MIHPPRLAVFRASVPTGRRAAPAIAALPEAGSQQAAPPGQPEPPEAAGVGAPSPGTVPVADFALRLQAEGMPEEALAYLRARGLLSERRLAAVAADPGRVRGDRRPALPHKSQQDPVLARALLVIAWQMAHEATRAGAATPALPAPAAPSGGAAPQAAFPARAPSALPPGEWKLQIERFESRWTPRRVFLQKLLIGPKPPSHASFTSSARPGSLHPWAWGRSCASGRTPPRSR